MLTRTTPARIPARRGNRRLATLLGASGLLLAACGDRPSPEVGAADSTYVALMARLLVIDAGPLPGVATEEERAAALDSARLRVLADYGLTPDSLLSLAGRIGSDPDRSRRLWETIGLASDSLRELAEAEAMAGEASSVPQDADTLRLTTPAPVSGEGRMRLRPTNPDSVRDFILRGKRPPPAAGEPPTP